ncbi:MAG: MlaD family protein [Gordonia amarae]
MSRLLRSWSACAVVALTLAVILTVSGCSLISPNDLPTAQSRMDGARLTVDFPSLVNLPLQSKVTVDGKNSGVVESTSLRGDLAVVGLVLRRGVAVDRTARVELRQDTLLGDTYVAVTNPAGIAHPLGDGGHIGQAQVQTPVQVETLMVSLSDFLNGGSVVKLGSAVSDITGAFPADVGKTRKMTQVLSETLLAWSDNLDGFNDVLSGVSRSVAALERHEDLVASFVSPDGLRHWGVVSNGMTIFELLANFAYNLKPLAFLAPMAEGVTGVLTQVVRPLMFPGWPNRFTGEGNVEALADLITDKVIPFLNDPELNVRLRSRSSNRGIGAQTVNTLRMIGMVP